MPIDSAQLASHLRSAREQADLSQDQVAARLGISRPLLAHFESGLRCPSSLQLGALANVYGVDPGTLFRDAGASRTAATALLRAARQDDDVQHDAIAACLEVAREEARIERLLDVVPLGPAAPAYGVSDCRSTWDAVQQGERLAALERDRLQLGQDPLRDLKQALELQGIRVGEVDLREDMSGLFVHDDEFGFAVFVRAHEKPWRRSFSLAHEYCHVLADRDAGWQISLHAERATWREVRANAFAAAFLMPEGGLRRELESLGKASQSRSTLHVAFDDDEPVVGHRRGEGSARHVEFHDVVKLAIAFGVSYDAALYRLVNVSLLTAPRRDDLARQRDEASALRKWLAPDEEAHSAPRPARLLTLALEACKRDLISAGKVRDIVRLLGQDPDEVETHLERLAGATPESPHRRPRIPRIERG